MIASKPTFALLLAAAIFAAPLTLAAAAPTASAAFAPPTALSATVADRDHIDLVWQNHTREPGGAFLEFRLNDEPAFSLLALLSSDVATFRHPDVARATRFSYRLVPFFGAPSSVVTITTGAELPPDLFRGETDGPLPDLPTTPPALSPTRPASLRHLASFTAAAPANLTARRNSTTTADLRWEDNAGDEDGFLVELSTTGNDNWQICALLPADTRSFRKTRLPPHTTCRFRVRAFFHGPPSNTATVTSPAEFRRPFVGAPPETTPAAATAAAP